MKKFSLLFILMIFTLGIISISSAIWYPGNGVLWIKYMDTPSVDSPTRYTVGIYSGRTSYLDTLTGLKWATNDQGYSKQWATNDDYLEPIWDDVVGNYSYPSGKGNYPAFVWCDDLGSKWRLPTDKELQSISSRAKTSSPYSYLPNIDSTSYWSSVENRSYLKFAWYLGTDYIRMGSTLKTFNGFRTLCVSN